MELCSALLLRVHCSMHGTADSVLRVDLMLVVSKANGLLENIAVIDTAVSAWLLRHSACTLETLKAKHVSRLANTDAYVTDTISPRSD